MMNRLATGESVRIWTGLLSGDVKAAVSARVSGYLLRRNFQEGQMVRQGDLLLEIDDRPFQAALDQAQVRLRKAELKSRQAGPSSATAIMDQPELYDAFPTVTAGVAAVEQARLNLQFTRILAPVDGLVAHSRAQIGSLVGPDAGALVMLTRIDPIQVHFEVGREFLAALFESKGAASDDCNSADDLLLDLVLPSGSLYPANGRVRSVEDPSKARNGTIRVVGEFPNPNGVLVPGMVARVRARFGKEF